MGNANMATSAAVGPAPCYTHPQRPQCSACRRCCGKHAVWTPSHAWWAGTVCCACNCVRMISMHDGNLTGCLVLVMHETHACLFMRMLACTSCRHYANVTVCTNEQASTLGQRLMAGHCVLTFLLGSFEMQVLGQDPYFLLLVSRPES